MIQPPTAAENAYRAMQAEAGAWALNQYAEKLSNRIPEGAPTEDYEDAIGIILELREEAKEKKRLAVDYRRANLRGQEAKMPAYDALIALYGPDAPPELATAIGHRDAEVLRISAEKLDTLPPGGEALKGPQWYRQGIHDAADLCRDWADHADHGDGPTLPYSYDTRTELAAGKRAEKKVKRLDEMAAAWGDRLPDTIRTAVAVEAIHQVTREGA
ncbi:hypothetical protein [Streptomyces sp. NBC_01483]|uniref:hypothetical protein n=1 Tax=Streptomyces sp. NBC_01483 TaxID=2903883 RepID=UPI002E31F916|nr:hypothetical protein [Streptomyces sp. NBC_01483]